MRFVPALVLLILLPTYAFAQTPPTISDVNATGTPYYVFAQPGEATIEIMVLNGQGSSGIYRIGVDTRLDELFVLTNSPLESEVENVRNEVSVRVYREEAGVRRLVYESPLEAFLAEPNRYPSLQTGDLFVVETTARARFSWRDALTVVSSISSVALLILRISSGSI